MISGWNRNFDFKSDSALNFASIDMLQSRCSIYLSEVSYQNHNCVGVIGKNSQMDARLLYEPQGSTHRLVRAPLGASWCDIFRFLLVLVRCGPSFSKIYRYWCGAVRNFEFLFGPGAVRSEFLKILWSWCGAVRNSEIYWVLVWCGPKMPFPNLSKLV